ncbi:MAG: sprT domain-containing protein [Flavobacteriaceae bacterium]|nr:sprT domain-containing protein [Flavobacteriaceae bacterium]
MGFQEYIVATAVPYVQSLLDSNKIDLKIVNQRQTKHGDFRRLPSGKMTITVNNNLNPNQFLITLVHEIAHYMTFQKFGRVKPHGLEWKTTFRDLMLPLLRPDVFPSHVLGPLALHLKNPKASTDSDPKLSLVLKNNEAKEGTIFVHQMEIGACFMYRNQQFKRGKLRRTRIECLNLENKKLYLFHQNAEVELLS